jgi:iron transport multicopper oxidase
MSIVMMDGLPTIAQNASQIMIAAAQRYSVIITANANPSKNYGILASMDKDMFDTIILPTNLKNNVRFANRQTSAI